MSTTFVVQDRDSRAVQMSVGIRKANLALQIFKSMNRLYADADAQEADEISKGRSGAGV